MSHSLWLSPLCLLCTVNTSHIYQMYIEWFFFLIYTYYFKLLNKPWKHLWKYAGMTFRHRRLAHLGLTQIYGTTFSSMSFKEVLLKKIWVLLIRCTKVSWKQQNTWKYFLKMISWENIFFWDWVTKTSWVHLCRMLPRQIAQHDVI